MSWQLVFTKQAQRRKKISASDLKDKAQKLLDIIKENPYQTPPPYEKLVGDFRVHIQENKYST
ncbi:hypothetical protein [Desulfopila inferna]|uniref:hypothetical protein n=1 Tax=Desulfopila inferna TaxID=468528 RepID=UPI001F060893|nr:hypothetical protein [Desulfopila inferna]